MDFDSIWENSDSGPGSVDSDEAGEGFRSEMK
jgi:hypothetical protein